MRWIGIKDFEDLYEVNQIGQIRSIKSGIIKKLRYSWDYYNVNLWRKGVCVCRRVHRIVATAFIANPKNKPQVNHKNGIKTDNRVENLEWVTPSENGLHSFANGLQKAQKGASNGMSKLTYKKVNEIRVLYAKGHTQKVIADRYGVSFQQVSRIVNNLRWN